jgi:hypothetical protein
VVESCAAIECSLKASSGIILLYFTSSLFEPAQKVKRFNRRHRTGFARPRN